MRPCGGNGSAVHSYIKILFNFLQRLFTCISLDWYVNIQMLKCITLPFEQTFCMVLNDLITSHHEPLRFNRNTVHLKTLARHRPPTRGRRVIAVRSQDAYPIRDSILSNSYPLRYPRRSCIKGQISCWIPSLVLSLICYVSSKLTMSHISSRTSKHRMGGKSENAYLFAKIIFWVIFKFHFPSKQISLSHSKA